MHPESCWWPRPPRCELGWSLRHLNPSAQSQTCPAVAPARWFLSAGRGERTEGSASIILWRYVHRTVPGSGPTCHNVDIGCEALRRWTPGGSPGNNSTAQLLLGLKVGLGGYMPVGDVAVIHTFCRGSPARIEWLPSPCGSCSGCSVPYGEAPPWVSST